MSWAWPIEVETTRALEQASGSGGTSCLGQGGLNGNLSTGSRKGLAALPQTGSHTACFPKGSLEYSCLTAVQGSR